MIYLLNLTPEEYRALQALAKRSIPHNQDEQMAALEIHVAIKITPKELIECIEAIRFDLIPKCQPAKQHKLYKLIDKLDTIIDA